MLREIPGVANYAVDEDGQVWRVVPARTGQRHGGPGPWKMAEFFDRDRLRVALSLGDGNRGNFEVARLVAAAFPDRVAPHPLAALLHVGFKNGDPRDVRPDNLFWDERRPIKAGGARDASPSKSRRTKTGFTRTRHRPFVLVSPGVFAQVRARHPDLVELEASTRRRELRDPRGRLVAYSFVPEHSTTRRHYVLPEERDAL